MYVDSSALLKLYLDEPEQEECRRLLSGDPEPATARVSLVEVRRNLVRRLRGGERARARAEFDRDWEIIALVEVDESVCERAAELAEATGVRSLDAVHLSAAERVGGDFLTYDRRQAEAARAMGWTVLGA